MTPRAVLPKCASAERPSARISSRRADDAEAGPVCGSLDTAGEFNTGPRVGGEQEVDIEVDVVAEARDLRAGGDAEGGLHHAPEHDPEPERAGAVRHPHRLADPARLGELDHDAVRPLCARRDVGEGVAVLVD